MTALDASPTAYDIWSATYLGSNLALSKKLGHQTVLQVCEASSLAEVVPGQEQVP